MQSLTFLDAKNEGLKILCLGAHCDDIEIGCGGTLLKFIEEYEIDLVNWVVFTSNKTRKKEALSSVGQFMGAVNKVETQILDFKDGYLPSEWDTVKDVFESIKDSFDPDIIFTHYRSDLHQDHKLINKFTWNTFRNHLILEYEIPKYDGDIGNPNLFVPLKEEYIEKKKEILVTCFKSQLKKQWFDDSLLWSLPRLRGVQCASKTNYAEAFYCRKLIM
ncbi:PIG-L family deacetylase [Balneolaceae bacterium YR4-1]|uniref:PIG-L family deacetylase n=1 Tax=Halalkalibaculum roseum TaxID=2709311 RepID=A0A6M1SZQ4_9BACT|nr:PIG-L deacetylase family protein [Halalkalibaculum roseum]NGP76684.1 PIG-L family deacetylase [Halalkalibaculum roseum]